MSLLDLKTRYELPKNTKSRQAINYALRAELVGGDDLLDALPLVDRLVVRLRERGLAGVDEAQAALDGLRRTRDVMESIIRDRYEMPAAE